MSGADYPDFATPQAHASAIAATGVPLLNNANLVAVLSGQAVTAASPYLSPVYDLNQVSYDIQILATTISAATVPFLVVQMQWQDSVSGAQMPDDTYVIPAAEVTTFTVSGRGPVKADTVRISITCLDPTQTISTSMRLLQHSRPLTVDRWSWINYIDNGLTVPAWILPSLPSDNTCLGLVANLTIPASTTETYLFGMYNGPVFVGINMNSGVLSSLLVQLAPVPSSYYSFNNPLGAYMAPSPGFQIAGPRSPIRVELVNQATTSIEVTVGLWALSQS